MRIVAAMLATAAAVLALAATAGAATISVQIKSTGFSPSTIALNHGDQVTWKNTDKVDHQVVADDGSFASPILHAGQSYTATFSRAGTFRYHDSYAAKHTGKITVKGPPPSLTLALSAPIVDYGTVVTLSGAISTGAANQSVEIDAQPYGQASPIQLVILKTGTGGTFSYTVTPSIYTTYVARWNNTASGTVLVQVAPKLRLLVGGNGYMKAALTAPISMAGKHVSLQRLSSFGQWVNLVNLTLGTLNGRLFKPALYLPKGISHIRVFLSVNQAGNGLLSAQSGTQTVNRVK
ncbi:MAG TPA: cupredoxin domain-containing protein [Gaiellaceae bacterium]